MPINPNIALAGIQSAPPRRSLMDRYAQSLQLRNALTQQDAMESEAASRTATQNALRTAYDPATGALDWDKAESAVAASGDPVTAMNIRKMRMSETTAGTKAKAADLDLALKRLDAGTRILGTATDQASYDAARAQLRALDIPDTALPPVYDPKAVEQAMQSALSVKDRLTMKATQDYRDKSLSIAERRAKAAEERARKGSDTSYTIKQNAAGEYVAIDPRNPTNVIRTGERAPAKSGGLQITGYDEQGRPLIQVGGAPGATVTPAPTIAKDAQKALLNAQDSLFRMDRIAQDYSRDLLTYQGRAKAAVAGVKDKAGMASPDDESLLKRRRRFTQNIDREFNAYRKDITGAAAAIAELEALKKATINSDLGPAEFEAAYGEYKTELLRTIRLRQKLLREGISLESPEYGKRLDAEFTSGADDDPMARGEELEAAGMDDAKVEAQLRKEGYL